MSTPDQEDIDIEAILDDLYASEINAEISWFWDGGINVKLGRRINVKLGDPLNGYEAKAKLGTFREAVLWLRDNACSHYRESEFVRKYGGFV